MNRNQFLKKLLVICTAISGISLLEGKSSMAQAKNTQPEKRATFKEKWIVTLMKNMEMQLDEHTRCRLMESCGRECAKRGAIKIAESSGDINRMIQKLSSIPDLDIQQQNQDMYRVVYHKCFCDLVKKDNARLPNIYCECSRGWLLEMFETAAGKPVNVTIIQTIKRGGKLCEFEVRS